MKFLTITALILAVVDLSLSLTAFQLRYKISKAQCEPVKGYENKVVPCYDFGTKKLVDPKDCGKKIYAHCCIYDCKCIIKGAGSSKGIVPDKYKLSKNGLPKTESQTQLVKGCIPDAPLTDKTGKETSNKSAKKPISKNIKPRKPASKLYPGKPTFNKPMEAIARKPSPKKPFNKRPGVKTTIVKRPTSTKPARKPSAKKPCKRSKPANSLSLGLFSRLSFMMSNIGFNSQVVTNDDCE